jgi:hypothetical protein
MNHLLRIAATTAAAVAMLWCAVPANAEPIPPGCEQVPIFGLSPHVRIICDTKIYEDGSWDRVRILRYIGGWEATCGGIDYRIDAVSRRYDLDSHYCPPGRQRDERDFTPDKYIQDEYRVTWDTIPPGEPGHLD